MNVNKNSPRTRLYYIIFIREQIFRRIIYNSRRYLFGRWKLIGPRGYDTAADERKIAKAQRLQSHPLVYSYIYNDNNRLVRGKRPSDNSVINYSRFPRDKKKPEQSNYLFDPVILAMFYFYTNK